MKHGNINGQNKLLIMDKASCYIIRKTLEITMIKTLITQLH